MDSTQASDKNAEKTQKAGEEQELQAELAKRAKEVEEYKTLTMYLRADMENYKKRAAREKEEFARFANESLILELLDVYENLGRAVETARKTDDQMAKGLDMIYARMKAVLESHGLKPIKTVGEKFNPYMHEAVMQEVDEEHDDDTVLDEFQKGYTLNAKVIRCAKVKVSKRGD